MSFFSLPLCVSQTRFAIYLKGKFMRRSLYGVGLTFVCALMLGCGESGPDLYEVKGKLVFSDGSPVSDVTVQFLPTESGMPASTGLTGSDGSFTLTSKGGKKGAVKGKHKVVIQAETEASLDLDTDAGREAMMNARNQSSGNAKSSEPTQKTNESGVPEKYLAADKTPLEVEITGAITDMELTIQK